MQCGPLMCYVANIGAASSYIAFVGCLVERLALRACCTRVAPDVSIFFAASKACGRQSGCALQFQNDRADGEDVSGHFSTARGQCKPSIGNRPHLQQQVSSWRFATRARSLLHSFRRPYCFSGAVCVFVGSSGYVDPRGFDTKSKGP